MGIKKIIKEEMDDFGWTKDVDDYEPKVGDTVRCKEGYTSKKTTPISMYGGRGYKPNKEFIIGDILEATNFDSRVVLWPDDGGHGVYAHAVEVIDFNIKEEMGDFDWASDVEPFKPFNVKSDYMITGVPSKEIETTFLDKLYELYGKEFIDKNKKYIRVLDNQHINNYDGPIVIYVSYDEMGGGHISNGWDYDDHERITDSDKDYEFKYTYNQFLNQSTQDQLTESDDFDWASDVSPFEIEPLTVVWLDTEMTPELIEKLYHEIKKANVHTRNDGGRPIELKDLDILKHNLYEYIRLYKDGIGKMYIGYGDNRNTYEKYQYDNVADHLVGKPYKEIYLSQML